MHAVHESQLQILDLLLEGTQHIQVMKTFSMRKLVAGEKAIVMYKGSKKRSNNKGKCNIVLYFAH